MYENVTQKKLPDKRYLNASDVQMRLSKTILRYDGQPVYCPGIHENSELTVILTPLKEGKTTEHFVCHSSDVLLDISSPPIGWCNTEEGPLYLARSPQRSQRQGLGLHHVDWLSPYHGAQHFSRGLSFNINEMLPVAKCILGEFPPIFKCIRERGGAFDRDWAIIQANKGSLKYFTIFHKHVPVGTFFKESRTFFFRSGRLTKTRRNSLEALLYHPLNNGVNYAIKEQKPAWPA